MSKPRITYRTWTDFEWSRAQKMAAENCSAQEIGREINRTAAAVQLRFRNHGLPAPRAIHDGRKPEDRRSALADNLEHDRQCRIEAQARRDLNTVGFGDPPPGFSALDGKVGMT